MVILKAINQKTRETVVLPPFKLPPSLKHLAVQDTAVEARHFAATYALFRVCSMKNIHMMLPPTYRDLWKKEFQDLKSEDAKEGRSWMYEADPFAAKQEREEAQVLMAKKRDEREKQKAKDAAAPANVLAAARSNGGNVDRNVMRGWTNVPKIEMGKRTRAQIEGLVRRDAIWNPHQSRISEFQCRNIINEFTGLGFRRSHVEEAIAECKDREETLEWLLVHVPEDDLPKWSLPEGYTAGVSMASGNMRREASIERLAEAGYSGELCARMLDECDGSESKAAEMLQLGLVCKDPVMNPATSKLASWDLADANEANSTWTEEQDTLAAIYGEHFICISSNLYQIQLQIPCLGTCILGARKSLRYPQQPPLVSISSPGLPAYIRLSILRQLIEHANADLLGAPMILNLVGWLENEATRIVENPGQLRDISAAASGYGKTQKQPHSGQALKRPLRTDSKPSNSQQADILKCWQAKQATSQQIRMLNARISLPAWKLRDDIVKAVNTSQVTIISGQTGSGKSTQSVQFILDDMIQRQLGASANIVCTQPRRISALGLADRVSDERCSIVGEEVGYAIRGDSKLKPGITKITFVTTGVLLRRLQTSGGSKDDISAALADVSHVVVDEVHERSLDTDFLLVLLRDVLAVRKDLKVILMSATLDAGVFANYFSASTVARIEIQGRTYPVTDYYLDDVIRLTGFTDDSRKGNIDDSDAEDGDSALARAIHGLGMRINYDLIASTVQAIDSQLGSQEGGILIFLPGTMEIQRTLEAVQRKMPNVHALPLHASLMPIEQRRVFPLAPRGKRKIIAATNVAETSITIEDIVAVIDCGKVKETSFDPQNNMVKLEEVWASRAACKQRRGRAGRVQAGKCYKLYTRNAEGKMAERPEPEIRRVPLEQLCLSVRAMGIIDVPTFLASALTPPDTMAVEGAVDLLGRMGALDGDELTALGRHLSMIPADLRCGKLMVYGATFGCLEACLTIAAILTVKSPFISPQAKREESKAARMSFSSGQGDLICDLRAYEEWFERKATSNYRDVKSWCDQNYLSNQTLNDINSNRTQYLSSLKEAAFLPSTYHSSQTFPLNAQNSNQALIRALVAGAFNPQLARIDFPDKKFAPSMSGAVELDPEARAIKFFNQDNGRVFVHPTSTIFGAQGFPGGSVYLSYFNKMATSKVFIRELTPFNAYSLLLFSGPITLDTLGRGLIVDGWLRLRGWARIGVLISRLRVLLDGVLARKIDDPGLDVGGSEVVGVVRRLVEFDGLDR
jgi:ATP-dependent RNA helicase DHX57